MKDLLKKAVNKSDQAEVFFDNSSGTSVEFSNAKLHDIESSFQSGYSLRIIKDGMLGFSYTKNLIDPDGLVGNAVRSLDGNVKADYNFPETGKLNDLDTYDPQLQDITSEMMVDECKRVSEILKAKTKAEIELGASVYQNNGIIANSTGTSLALKQSHYAFWMNLCYPGGAAGLVDIKAGKSFSRISNEQINNIIEMYNLSEKPLEPSGGKMQVIFMPSTMYALMWRLRNATSGESIFKKTSPLEKKLGELIFSDKITIFDDPLNDSLPGARSFDDEGIKTGKFSIIEKGVIKNFYYDLNYAAKLNTLPTGHGYRTARWGGDKIMLKPSPNLDHLRMDPGNKSLAEMISSMDRGIILSGAMGAHSGNIPNGDYSVGVSPGLYVEKGRIVGRVKDAMVAGNIYETLQNVISVENKNHLGWGGYFPSMLCDKVSVSTK